MDNYCTACNKKLRPFTETNDWEKRKLHKSCWVKQNKRKYSGLRFTDLLTGVQEVLVAAKSDCSICAGNGALTFVPES